jgi:predicted ATPase
MYHFPMIQRFYIHNFRCLENFELPISRLSTVLLIGKNGAGKSTVGVALEILQRIANGTNRVGELVAPEDIARGCADAPMRFEIEVELASKVYKYVLALDFPEGFKELRVFEEKLIVDGEPCYTREVAQVHLAKIGRDMGASFRIDWHLVALPIIQQSPNDPLFIFKHWLASMLILRPQPSLIRGDSEQETLQPNAQVTNLGAWFSGLIASAPSVYTKIDEYLKQVMPDLQDMKNPIVGKDARSLVVQFSNQQGNITLPFGCLSDGEKCFMIYALVIAANSAYGPLLCFWDEPDNYLAPAEIGQSVMALRRAFQAQGQIIVTSHNPEAIRRFSDENTLLLYRNSHLEPTIVQPLEGIRASGELKGDFIEALVRGDIGA